MAEVSVAGFLLALFTSFFWKLTWGSIQADNSSDISSLSPPAETLLIFYTQTNGDYWKINTNWTTSDVCTWYGVECSPSGVIVSLSLPNNNLTGKLGVELSQIQTLEKIDLSGNSLRSPIPYSFGSFSSLTHLDLSSNYLFGIFPPEFSDLIKLSFLNLSCNFLSELLPNSFFVNTKNLTHFDVHDNDLSGDIPSDLTALATLQVLDLSENSFVGEVLSFLSGKPYLTWVSLRGNFFAEPIPIDFCDGKSLLTFLDLSQNNFWGELPPLQLTSLTTLIARDNNFGGQLSNLSGISNIQGLDLSQNLIEGEIPHSVYGLINLISLDLSGNRLTGSITSNLNQLVKLQKLNLDENDLSGNLPTFTSLTNLKVLQLRKNHLTGAIPGSPNTPSLTKLDLSRNKFLGSFPATLCGLEFLEELDLSSNQLSGTIPYPCFQSNLQEVDLSSNFLEDLDWRMFYSSIKRLSLSFNAMNMNWSTCTQPPSVKSSLVKLDLDNNLLEGNVVDSLNCFSSQFPFLSALNLAGNKLTFPQDVPFRLPTFSSMNILNLSSNLIEGMVSDLGESYLDLSPFVNVDLSYNPISGTLILPNKWHNLVNIDISFTSISPCVDSSFFMSHSLVSYRAFGLICTVVPDEIGFVEDSLSPWTDGQISCPRWKFPNQGLLDVDGAYFDYIGCRCIEEFTFWNPATNLCEPCPTGLMCSTAVHNPVHTVLPGYYPVTANGTYETNQSSLITSQLLVCNSPNLCNPRRSASFECAPGRDLDSLLCSKCDVGYYTAGEECWSCQASYEWIVPIVCFALMGLGLIFIWASASKPGHNSPIVQMVAFWLQLTMILEHTNRLGPGISNTDPWTMLANFSWIQTITNLQPWAFECTWPTFDYIASFWIMLIVPLVLLIIPMVTHFIFWIFSFCSPRLIAPLHWQTRIWFISLFLLNLFYFPVNQRFLEVFNCSTEAGVSYLVAAPWIKCEDSVYTQMRLGAILGLLFYLPLWPLWCTYQLLFKVDYIFESISENKVPLEDRSPEALQMQSLQFLWGGLDFTLTKEDSQPFTDRVRYLWLVLGVGARKFALALILSLIPRGNILLPLLLLTTLGLTIGMNLVVKPYVNPWHNYLEIALLSEVFMTFITGTLGSSFDGPVDLIVYILHGITLLGILILATRGLWQCFLSCQQKSKNEDDVVNVSDVFSDYLSIMTYKDLDSRR